MVTNATQSASNETTTKELSAREKFRQNKVMLAVSENPKKAGSMSFDRFKNYFKFDYSDTKKLPTVGDLLKAGVRMDDIRHDTEHKFIVVGEAEIAKWQAAEEKRKADELEAARKLVAAADKGSK